MIPGILHSNTKDRVPFCDPDYGCNRGNIKRRGSCQGFLTYDPGKMRICKASEWDIAIGSSIVFGERILQDREFLGFDLMNVWLLCKYGWVEITVLRYQVDCTSTRILLYLYDMPISLFLYTNFVNLY